MKHIFLDSTPLGLMTDPKSTPVALAARAWVEALVVAGHRVFVPEIIRYEIRREFLRAGKKRSIRLLNGFCKTLEFLPLNSIALEEAAELWAKVRSQGKPTSGKDDLDADCILAGQLHVSSLPNAIIATGNLKHLSLLAPADLWHNILP